MSGPVAAPRRLRVLPTHEAIVPEHLPEATVVVIDVLLATTTLVTALENGARRVLPVGTLHEAERVCGGLDAATLLRGGEQDALAIDGFDCGPFPEEYPADSVRGRDVVFVSTNGTRAIARAAAAGRLLVASVRNGPAVGRHLEASTTGDVLIVCAGSRGRCSLEDLVGAGVVISAMDTARWRLDDPAWVARDLVGPAGERAPMLLREARAGRWFLENGRRATLDFAGEVGASRTVAAVREGELVRVDGEPGTHGRP